MVYSAFRSASKRGTLSPTTRGTAARKEDPPRKIRRSKSVSALSRSAPAEQPKSPRPLPSVSEFANTRDNPLFSASDASPTDSEKSFGDRSGKGGGSDGRKGRSSSRGPRSSSPYGGQMSCAKGIGRRGLSKIDVGRRHRSVSWVPSGNFESDLEQEQEYSSFSKSRNISTRGVPEEKFNRVSVEDEPSSNPMRSLEEQAIWNQFLEHGNEEQMSLCEKGAEWEDVAGLSKFSEAEEKTIKSVCEQIKTDYPLGEAGGHGIYVTVRAEVRRAISELQNNLHNVIPGNASTVITSSEIADLAFVNQESTVAMADIRKQYAVKLEQSHERARKLREDLDTEERCSQELCNILKNILPDTSTFEDQKSQLKRKTSTEREKMSQQLTEEAFSYFDECVSISTFESPDYSSLEDHSPTSAALCDGGYAVSRLGLSSSSAVNSSNDHHEDSESQSYFSFVGSDFTANSSLNSPKDTMLLQHNQLQDDLVAPLTPTRNSKLIFTGNDSCDIRHYIKKFDKGRRRDSEDDPDARSNYDPDDYASKSLEESLLYEKVTLKNRIESGGLLLCHARYW